MNSVWSNRILRNYILFKTEPGDHYTLRLVCKDWYNAVETWRRNNTKEEIYTVNWPDGLYIHLSSKKRQHVYTVKWNWVLPQHIIRTLSFHNTTFSINLKFDYTGRCIERKILDGNGNPYKNNKIVILEQFLTIDYTEPYEILDTVTLYIELNINVFSVNYISHVKDLVFHLHHLNLENKDE